MGQQQLLLLVLGVVIVGLAVVVGIEAFTTNRQKTAADDIVSTSARISGDAIAWSLHSTVLGGGGGSPANLTFTSMSYDEDASGAYTSGDATYTLDVTAARVIVVAADATQGVYAKTGIFGPDADCIVTENNVGSAPSDPSAPAGCSW